LRLKGQEIKVGVTDREWVGMGCVLPTSVCLASMLLRRGGGWNQCTERQHGLAAEARSSANASATDDNEAMKAGDVQSVGGQAMIPRGR